MFIGLLFLSRLNPPQFLSPFIASPEISSTRIESDKPIIAFLPYWTVNDVQIQYHLVDYIAYFGLNFNYDGTIQKMQNHNMEMGWYYLSQGKIDQIFTTAQKNDVKKMIVFTAFQNDLIDTLISNPQAKAQAIKSIVEIVDQYQLDAVNLDFEYNLGSQPSSISGSGYPEFIADLKKQIPQVEISICLYANAIIKNFPYQADQLAQVSDQIILMAYDFHNASSSIAGPVAPINSDTSVSISSAINSAIKKQIDLSKIILAIPFYGYEWRTDSDQFGANTYPNTGAMASYKRVHQLIKDRHLISDWSATAMSPFLVYQDDSGFTKQIYYENDQSIDLKLQFVNQVNLGGTAIWAIGYEGTNASLWYIIESWRKGE